MKEENLLGRDVVAENFVQYYSGKLDKSKIDQITRSIMLMTHTYPASANCYGALFYVHVDVVWSGVTGLPKYPGNGGGFYSPGVNRTEGLIFTDDSFRLTTTTVSFSAHLTAINDTVLFFDSSSNLVGNYQGIGAGSVAGGGGGSGSWIGVA